MTAALTFATWTAGELEEAAEAWEATIESYEAAGDVREATQSHVALAALLHQLGRTTESIAQLEESLDGFVAMGDVAGQVMALDFLAAIAATADPGPAVFLAARTEAAGRAGWRSCPGERETPHRQGDCRYGPRSG